MTLDNQTTADASRALLEYNRGWRAGAEYALSDNPQPVPPGQSAEFMAGFSEALNETLKVSQ